MSYPVYYPIEDDTLPILFASFDGGDGSSITMTGLAVTDIEIYKDGGVTQRSSDAGYTLLDTDGIDFDGITGIHGFSIDLSNNTDAGFFVVGPWYHVVVSAITIDAQTVSFIAAAFRILDATRGMAGTALPDAAADAAGGLAISDAGGLDLDAKLANTNEVTAARMAALTDWINGGRLDLLLDAIPTTAMRGTDSAYTGTPPTVGAIADQVWDEILTGATHNIATSAGRRLRGIQEFQGYALGAIWIDTVNGVAGTTDYENGTVENPVDNIADANTLAASLGFPHFILEPGSSITLAAAQTNQLFEGDNWTLALGGQNVAGSTFRGAAVSGVMAGTGVMQKFIDCVINVTSVIKGTLFIDCQIANDITVVEAGEFLLRGCASSVAGAGAPKFDFGSGLNSSNLSVRRHSGGWEIENMGAGTGTYNATFEGHGQIIWAASCSATSNASIRGHWKITDNASGAVTETKDDITVDVDAVLADLVDGGRLDLLIDAIKAVTDLLPDAGALTAIGTDTARLTAVRAAILTDWINGGRLDLLLDAIPTTAMRGTDGANTSTPLTAAQVNAEVVDALATDTYAEPGQGAPAATATLAAKINYLYKMWRNLKNQNATTFELYDDAGAVVDQKATVSDDGTTAVKQEIVSGP